MPRLEHKTAVITGASSGIGRAMALSFAREGAQVVVNYNRSLDKAEATVSEITAGGGRAIAIQADVSCPEDVARLIRDAQAELGRIDIWVNNAGADILTGTGAALDDPGKLHRLIDVDLKGTIHCCWALAPVMQAGAQARRGGQGHGHHAVPTALNSTLY